MKYLLLIGFSITATVAIAQVRDSTQVHVTPGLYIDRIKEKNNKLTLFSDSLNSYSKGPLPAFLFNPCFDWDTSLWDDAHSPTSLRWKVLSKVTNKKGLKTILSSNDNRLKEHCNHLSDSIYPRLSVPRIKESFYQLIKERYKQL